MRKQKPLVEAADLNVAVGDGEINAFNDMFPTGGKKPVFHPGPGLHSAPTSTKALVEDSDLRAVVGDGNIAIQNFFDTIPDIPGLPKTLGGIPTLLALGGGALGLILLLIILKRR